MSETGTEARELGDARAQLSTAPAEETTVPSLGPVGWLRWMWRQLTSMRVALILLFLLSLGAVPGSLIPQTGVDATRVADFRAAHETLGPLYDKLGLFHVYSSVWFSAIYILLFVSLAGCIVPRTRQFVGQLRSRPPEAPRNLTRLPVYTTWRTGAGPEEVLEAAGKLMRKRRFRTHSAGTAVASEKGYLREAGNLLFHTALFGLLISFAVGSLWKSEGGKLVVEGSGFSNSLTQYDDFTPGTFHGADDLEPFGFRLEDFEATFAGDGPQKGTPRLFKAHVGYWVGAGGEERKSAIEVNSPLDVNGTTVYLIGHGYAPNVTVRDARGEVVHKGPTPFLPIDSNITSQGVVKVMDGYRDAEGEKDQLAFQGLFTPTFGLDEVRGPHSTFPALDYPVLSLTAYHGSLGVDSGTPQNVYQLDDTHMKQYKSADGDLLRKALRPGDTMSLPDGAGSITFDGVDEWATFKVSHQVGNGAALASAATMVVGLAGSLFIQRRRIWVRAVRGADGVTVVEMAGLGRSESARIAEELGDLAVALRPGAPVLPEPSDESLPDEGARA